MKTLPTRTRFLATLLTFLLGAGMASPSFGQQNSSFSNDGSELVSAGNHPALADLDAAIQANPQDPHAFFRRAYVYIKTGQYDLALQDINQCLQLDPTFAPGYFRRAFVYMEKDNDDSAIADLGQAISLNPKFVQAYLRRALVYVNKGNYDLALADLNQVLTLSPDNTVAFIRRIKVYMMKGDFASAIAGLNQSITAEPQNAAPHNQLAWLLATCPQAGFRDGKKAVNEASIACQITGWKSSPELDTFAAACAEAGDFDSAIKWETVAMPNFAADSIPDAEKRLALYQAHQPYHVDHYEPGPQTLVVN